MIPEIKYLNQEMLFEKMYDLRYTANKKSENRYEITLNKTGEVIASLDFENRRYFVDVNYPKLIKLMQDYYKVGR